MLTGLDPKMIDDPQQDFVSLLVGILYLGRARSRMWYLGLVQNQNTESWCKQRVKLCGYIIF